MSNSIALDLTTARKKSGLIQKDCAHLLEVDISKISNMENGKVLPTLTELCTLSLIYGRTLENLARGLFAEVRNSLPERLETLPLGKAKWLPGFNRNNTLNKVEDRLQKLNELDRGSA